MSESRIIAVFLKLPQPGGVKTRLAAGLTGEDPGAQAVEIYKTLVASVFQTLSQSDFDQLRVLYDPPESEEEIRAWLQPMCETMPDLIDVTFVPQAGGDLGNRLQSAIHDAHDDFGNAKVAAIGTDCIEISPALISQLWQNLEDCDLVFGPTFDGGYYLVGTRQKTPEIFTDIPWSTEETLAASLESGRSAGRKIQLLDKLNDVDTVEDWEIAKDKIGRS